MSEEGIEQRRSERAFVKYHGLGNDFILIDNTQSCQLKYDVKHAIQICDRHFGIGADGLVFVLPGQNGCDYTMRLYNSDGTEPQMCGNAIRCVAKFLHRINHKDANDPGMYRIWTNAGAIVPTILGDGSVEVDMGEPILDSNLIPTTLQPNASVPPLVTEKYPSGAVVDQEMRFGVKQAATSTSGLDEQSIAIRTTAVSMSNPHSVRITIILKRAVVCFIHNMVINWKHYTYLCPTYIHCTLL